MKLRVVTATRGGSVFWSEAAASVAAAAPGAEHVVVCRAASVAAFQKNSPGLAVFAEKSTGLYAALNQGLREAPSDWDTFTWLNDDDLLLSPGFRLLADFAADITCGRVVLIDSRGARVGELPVARRARDLEALLARGIMPIAQPGTIIRRSVWEKIGGFDESYQLAGDLDFFVRALLAGASFAFGSATVAAFRLSAGQLSQRREEMEGETLRALRPLANAPRPAAALWRFRLGNLGVYFERLRRHGWVSMQELQHRTK